MALPPNIRHVDNEDFGCFVACVAMLLGKDYNTAFKDVHPTRSIYSNKGGGITPTSAFRRLKALGLQPRKIEIDSIKNLQQTALVWLRWSPNSHLMHSVVYEHKTKLFWDPNSTRPLGNFGISQLDKLKETVVILDSYNPPEGPIVPAVREVPRIPVTWQVRDYIRGCSCAACGD